MPSVPRPAVPIAIIGVGCRFPGGVRDTSSFWDLMIRGRCAIREIPSDRWSLDGFYDPTPDLPDRSYSKWGGFLDDISSFDPAFFGLSPREAEGMDPQQRLLLMVAAEASADARLPLSALREAPTGVFIGVSNIDYGLLQRYRPGQGELQAGTGTALSIVANRVSNRLDLSGPSLGVDTACSSALVAVDTACRHLADGSCDFAMAGGVNVLLDPRMFITFSRAHMLSPTGRIRAFDADADGFVRGEGVGVVLLRRLDDALTAGDPIYAVIEATAVNQDGRTGTITEPSEAAQIAMLRSALARAAIRPADVAYVEAHGTGTPVGDPIEARAIGTVIGAPRATPLPIGSVKTNIGHLEPAAGIAGLIKAALVLAHRAIPPSVGFARPNPAIDLASLGLTVASETTALDGTRALVNSFGFGGTNACAVLSAVGWVKRRATRLPRHTENSGSRLRLDPAYADPISILLSGPTPQHVEAFAARLLRAIDGGELGSAALPDIAAALATQRDHGEHRAVIIATDIAELRARLECLADGRDWPASDRHAPPQIIRGRARAAPKLVLTMTGQGGQWWAMGRELIDREPAFKAVFEEFDRVFEPISGWSTLDELLKDEAGSRIDDAAITPAVMFAFQAGLAEIWRARGVTPDIVLGHSFGEVTAAYLAGGICMADVARLVTHRGLIRGRVDRKGTMAAIGLGTDAIRALLPADGSIEIGGINSPSMVTLTGEEAAIDTLIARLNADDPSILTRKLALDFAYHSSWFEPVEQIFKSDVGHLATSPPRLPVISTVTGVLNEDFTADYWWRNLRQPVLYQQGIETALAIGGDVFLELGPHRTLSSMTAACAAGRGDEVTTVSTLDRRWGDLVSLAVATAQLYMAGVSLDWRALYGDDGRAMALPAQPWLLREIWSEPEEAARHMRPSAAHPLLGRRDAGAELAWTAHVSLANQPWLADHRLDGTCVMPAAAYLEMLIVAARELHGQDAVELIDVAFPTALYLGADDEIVMETRCDRLRRRIEIHSRPRTTDTWELRASARAYPVAADGPPFPTRTTSSPPPCGEGLGGGGAATLSPGSAQSPAVSRDPAAFYRNATARGYGWGRHFQGLQRIALQAGIADGEIAIDAALSSFAFDPRVVDSALQLMVVAPDISAMQGVIPARIERVVAKGRLGGRASARVSAQAPQDASGVVATIEITAPSGERRLLIERLHAMRRTHTGGAVAADPRAPRFYVEMFEPVDITPGSPQESGAHLVFARDGNRRAEHIVAELRSRGLQADLVHVPSRGGDRTFFRDAVADHAKGRPPAAIIFVSPLGGARTADDCIFKAAELEACEALSFSQGLAEVASCSPLGRIVFITPGARALTTDDVLPAASFAEATILGVARTLAMELPNLDVRLIDIDAETGDGNRALVDVLTSTTPEREIAIRSGRVFAARLVERAADDLPPRRTPREKLPTTANFALRRRAATGADGLVWREAQRTAPGPSEVVIETRAVGLNFRDVMAVAGLLPPGAEPVAPIDTLGLELAGVVVDCGRDVRDLDIGTPVLGMGTAALQRYVAWPRAALHRVPTGMSFTAAATLPSAYLTAHYALNVLGRLAAGETVLIHSAAGGVGLAAMALARRAGAHIIATAGTAEKRAHLERSGASHVLDSRSLAFADEVRRITDGRGVDVVLNSLGGAFIDKGLDCLAPYGRFLELGKRDVYGGGAIALKALRANISLHVIDLAGLIRDKPAIAAQMTEEVLEILARGEIAPLPAKVFTATAVRHAFVEFAAARHIGKLVVDMSDAALEIEGDASAAPAFDPAGTYLVTGGASGFGLAVARWLAEHGAGRVVLASRSGSLPREPDACFEALKLDVGDASAVDRAVARLARAPFPLRGIIHAAVAYDDAALPDQTPAHVRAAMAPKVAGAINLTRALERHGLAPDFFVSFSSLAQVVGWPGQANYAAANASLEALAAWQRARGIPGICVNWGALGESGHVARSGRMQGYLDSAGWIAMSDADALGALGRVLASAPGTITIAAADWPRLTAAHPAIASSPRTAALARGGRDGEGGRDTLVALKGAALRDAALQLVHREAAKVLRTAPAELAGAVRLDEAGIDSLSSFELRNRLGQSLSLELPMSRYATARTFEAMAALIAELVEERAGRPSS